MAPAVLLRAAVAMTGRFPALAGVDLEVGEGEAVVLMGPNGAGKTSVLRACAGLLRVSSGVAFVLGHDLVADPAAARREVAMLGHTAALYEDLSVTENVRFAVRAAAGDSGRVTDALERLGLGGRLARTQVSRLSAGQKKRVALAVTVARSPRLWLLDEPHASLDASGRTELGEILAQALAQGATVLFASHEGDVAEAIAGRVVLLGGGRVLSETAPSQPAGAEAVVAFAGVLMWHDAVLVAGKDLRIEMRSRVLLNQVAPFGAIVLVLFAFALGPDASDLLRAAPGVFWVAVLFAGLLAVQRAFAIEGSDGVRDGLRLAGLDPAGVFLGKVAAVSAQLVLLEILLGTGAVLLFGAHVHDAGSLVLACLVGTAGLTASGVLYGALAAGLRVKETLLPLLVLPVVAPVLVAGTKVWQAALRTQPGTPVWKGGWMPLLIVFAVVYLVLGVLLYGVLQEEGA